jgi:GTPase
MNESTNSTLINVGLPQAMNINNEHYLPPENDGAGNIEYKKMFSKNIDQHRIIKLVTQATWRMDQGYIEYGLREAIYYIGINDNGSIGGLSLQELMLSIEIFEQIVLKAEAKIINSQFSCSKNGNFTKIKIHKIPQKTNNNELIIGLLGPTLCGKTSLVGHLSYGIDDNGEGNARDCVFRHDHEYDIGVTSSIKHDLIGFSNGKINNYTTGFIGSWEDIVKGSDKIINIIDMPGHYKYIKTTIFCLLTYCHDYICLMINADCTEYDLNTFFFHMFLCRNLQIPILIIINKTDLNNKLYNIIDKITNFCQNECNFNGINLIYNEINLINTFIDNKIPIVPISIVKKEKMDNLNCVLNNLPKNNIDTPISKLVYNIIDEKPIIKSEDGSIFIIYDIILLPELGNVIIGRVLEGNIKINDKLLIGPINNNFSEVIIKSIHKKQISNNIINKGEHGSLLIKLNDAKIRNNIDKRMMLVSPNKLNKFINTFYISLNKKYVIQNKQDGFNFNICTVDDINIGAKIMAFTNNVYESIEILELNHSVKDTDNIILKVKFKNDIVRYIEDKSNIVISYQPKLLFGSTYINNPN